MVSQFALSAFPSRAVTTEALTCALEHQNSHSKLWSLKITQF